jgi:hypothetical protein
VSKISLFPLGGFNQGLSFAEGALSFGAVFIKEYGDFPK